MKATKRKSKRQLRGASGGHARAKVIAKKKLDAEKSENAKLRKRIRKLKRQLTGAKASLSHARRKRAEAETQVADLKREEAKTNLRANHVIKALQKKNETTQSKLEELRDAHVVVKHELRMARRAARS